MSRLDSHEFEFPPGLGYARSINDRNASLNGFVPMDRRPSFNTLQAFPKFSAVQSRSVGVQDHEYNLTSPAAGNWSMAPNKQSPAAVQLQHFSPLIHHHHQNPAPPSPPSLPTGLNLNTLYHHHNDRDPHLFRHALPFPAQLHSPSSLNASSTPSLSTLWWGELEPWMDEEYAKQVCGLMGWDPTSVKVPHPTPDATTGQQSNNPGYCFLTFPTFSHAASVLAQINSGSNTPLTMPNSNKPFVLNWASSVQSSAPIPSFSPITTAQQQYPKEYSIFVGDLAPETSNSDLVAVFRNPVLGLRNDREPKFIRPFLSCKSAKIMLDPVTGVSRGYGFVRFTDECDQQRALIEMHGLYCLSRPMRISPATAKFKAPPTALMHDPSQLQFHAALSANGTDQPSQPVTIALPLPNSNQAKSVSAPIAATSSTSSIGSASSVPSLSGSNSTNSIPSGTSASSNSIASSAFASAPSDDMLNLPNHVLAQIAQQYANGNNAAVRPGTVPTSSITTPFAQEGQEDGSAPRYTISEESWKHQAQARAILGNLIGPNGEQLTSTDPYNTTVFVGGLSPLISEDTLRTFFAPFGDIHYVKVPAGKHCGFVQFVRKADAERAIEKMQGFPVGGSRIRLSWGRSQYKAAQAAAQAAQAAALQAQYQAQFSAPAGASVTPEQAMELLQKFGIQGFLDKNGAAAGPDGRIIDGNPVGTFAKGNGGGIIAEEQMRLGVPTSQDDGNAYDGYSGLGRQLSNPGLMPVRQSRMQTLSNFSPFSPDPNLYSMDKQRKDSAQFSRPELLPYSSKSFSPGFVSSSQDFKVVGSMNGKASPPSIRPSSGSRYGSYLDGSAPPFQMNQASIRPEGSISRPSSGQTTTSGRGAGSFESAEHDLIQDLNGTLASLDLDHTHEQWKSPAGNGEDPSGQQFQVGTATQARTPSP